MKQTINFYDFEQAFRNRNRFDNFGYDGLKALFDWITDFESDTGEDFELDVIGLCCEFTEYEDLEDFQSAYGTEYETMEDIEDQTTVIPIAGTAGFIIQNF